MEINKVKIVTDGGPWVNHNYACPVYYNSHKAVYDLDKGVFCPSWMAQKDGLIS